MTATAASSRQPEMPGSDALFILLLPFPEHERLAPFLQYKRETERLLAASSMEYVIFRADIFMDVAFTMMGSSIPLRGAEAATVLRPFPFANRHFERIKNSIESKHIAMIPGDWHYSSRLHLH